MEKMTITRALSELKTLDKKIDKKIGEIELVGFEQQIFTKILGTTLGKEDFIKHIKSEYDSLNDTIKRRDDIKKALLRSNIVTTINVGGETMSIADSIVKEKEIEKQEKLLRRMKSISSDATRSLEHNQTEIQKNADEMASKTDMSNVNLDEFRKIQDEYIRKNKLTLIDPLDLNDKIKKLEDYIETFKADLDWARLESNNTTQIEF